MTTVTFTCSRAELTVGVMQFEVWAVRNLAGQLYPGPKSSATYEVAPSGAVPPGPVDSLSIQVASRRLYQNRDYPGVSPDDTVTMIQYQFSPATYRHVDYRIGETETYHYEVWVDGEKVGYSVDASWGISECWRAENGEVCPIRPFRGYRQESLS